ncbi:MAG TPA: DUF1326 domain-containing protein [Gaiellaceae bacterium]
MSWRIAGTYLESCNCEAICPCRMIGPVPGGRSTHGVCFGALGWRVDEGHFDDVDLGGLAAVLVVQYDDDEKGSPWTIVLHLDERGTEAQRSALERILLGEAGGDVMRLPWIRKPRKLIDTRVSPVLLEGTTLRVGGAVALEAPHVFATTETVACGIPGYDRPGTELTTDRFAVDDAPFRWELRGNCAFTVEFEYVS